MIENKTFKTRLKQILPTIVLLTIAILFLIPLIWLVVASFDPKASLSFNVNAKFSLDNYKAALLNAKSRSAFLNSAIISVSTTLIVVVCSLLAAYPLSRYNLKYGQKITLGLLFLTSLPIAAIMVPVYQLFIILNLVNSIFGTIMFLSATSLPYGIWMSKNFLDSVSIDLEEAAWIDGASVLKTLIKIVIPLMLPGVFTVAITTFIGSWGNFFVPYILLQTVDKLPASVMIYQFFGQHTIIYGQLAAYAVIYLVPVFILYSFAQNYMSQGFTMGGGVKG